MRPSLRWMLAGLGFGLAGFVLVAADVAFGGLLSRADLRVFGAVSGWRDAGVPVHAAGWWLSLPGDWRTVAAAVVASAAWMLWRRQPVLAAWTVALGICSGVVSDMLKAIFERDRPPLGLLHTYSFPSGHTFAAAAALGAAILLATETEARRRHPSPAGMRRLWAIALAAWLGLGALTGLGRVLAQAHWLSDVLASWLLGLALVSGLLFALSRRARGGDPGPTAPAPKPGGPGGPG